MTHTHTAPTDVRSPELADLIECLSARLDAGEEINWEEVERDFPEHAAAARQLLPTLQRLAELSRASGSISPEGDPLPLGELGDYRISREIGRGGMGVVYEAEQISLGRRVALKVLPFAAVMDPRHLQRFKNEARAAASLDHPNIVKVYGVGCERGVHFIALQYIDGRSLADLIRERRDGPATPPAIGTDATRTYTADITDRTPTVARSPRTSPRTSLDTEFIRRATEWGIRAAEALEHAHGLGIVHRDIKPGNLLIDGRGEVFVADFGLAKVATDPGVTGTGDMVGTLRYMSPEQAGAQHDLVDHRSDIYSLGVTLYELLTLTPAFAGADHRSILTQITTLDPTAPRKLDGRIPRDLETVILKAIEKDPSRRYQSAKEFAADLRRVVSNEHVHARRATLLNRVGRFASRNRRLVATTVLIAIALVVATTFSAFQAVRATRAQAWAHTQWEAAEQAKAAAIADREKAEQAELDAKVFSDFLVNHFLVPEEQKGAMMAAFSENFGMLTREQALLIRPGVDMKMSEALAAAERGIKSQTFARRPLAEAAVRHALGLAWLKLGRHADSARHLRRAFELREHALGPDHEDTVNSAATLGRILIAAGRPDEAIPLFEEVRAQRERSPKYGLHLRAGEGFHHATTLTALYELAKAYRAAGRLPEAIRELELLSGRMFENVRPEPDRPEYARSMFSPEVVRDLATAYRDAGRGDDATRLWDDAFSRLRASNGPSEYFTQRVRRYWTSALHAEGQFDKAVEVNRMSVNAIRLEGRNQYELTVGLWHLGDSLLAIRRPAEAEPVLRESLALWEQTEPDRWPKFDVQRLLGEALLRQRRYADAEPLLLAGYAGLTERLEKEAGLGPSSLAGAADRLTELYTALGKPAEAAKWRAERAKYPQPQAPSPRPKESP